MRLAATVLALVIAVVAPATAQDRDPSFPQLTGRVVDAAGLLSPQDETELDSKLHGHEEKTTNQLVVVTLPSLQGYDIADFGVRLGRHWALGQKGVNNGALLIVAPNERAVRIEVGYGLEGTLTDALSSIVINGAILPRFRNGDFPGGIRAGVDDILTVLDGNGDELRQRAEAMRQADAKDDWISFLVVSFILGFWILILVTNYRRHGLKGLLAGTSMNRGGFGSSGGWSSGSSGGFSGGGGSFGGGGASGRW
ncbi:hypothetical protein GCM10007276_00810 [Agaricicola taiwanensis]|uniref:TPM domain-containing protein n=1 Tax=Agaricicola taiwanensis TaxID=591372 RepID=A0A8J2VDG3_9RHOB|nr:TPM domain-containing protein [Agaricicola taiwanensis]GGE27452.1 hypothetical protein GCM10007276_00810 [Agaricicola taiwanensis]